jgi:hypothetical protein
LFKSVLAQTVLLKQAQKEFIQAAGVADFDSKGLARAGELREEMKRSSREIARDPARGARKWILHRRIIIQRAKLVANQSSGWSLASPCS